VRDKQAKLSGFLQRENWLDLKRALTYTDTAPERKKTLKPINKSKVRSSYASCPNRGGDEFVINFIVSKSCALLYHALRLPCGAYAFHCAAT